MIEERARENRETTDFVLVLFLFFQCDMWQFDVVD